MEEQTFWPDAVVGYGDGGYGKGPIRTQCRRLSERGHLWRFREKVGPEPLGKWGAGVVELPAPSLRENRVADLKSENGNKRRAFSLAFRPVSSQLSFLLQDLDIEGQFEGCPGLKLELSPFSQLSLASAFLSTPPWLLGDPMSLFMHADSREMTW